MPSEKSRFYLSHFALNSFPMRVWNQTKALMSIKRVAVECLDQILIAREGIFSQSSKAKTVLFATFNVTNI